MQHANHSATEPPRASTGDWVGVDRGGDARLRGVGPGGTVSTRGPGADLAEGRTDDEHPAGRRRRRHSQLTRRRTRQLPRQ